MNEENKPQESNNENNNEIKNKKQEEIENNDGNNSDLGQKKNNSNFFNKSLNAVNLANNSLNGLNNMANNMGNNEDLGNKMTDPNETRNALNQMGNKAAQNINNATNLARGINNKIQNKKNKNNEDEKDDNNKDNKDKDDKKESKNEKNESSSIKSSIDNKENKKRKLLKGKNKDPKTKTKEELKKRIISFFMKLPLSLKLGIIVFGLILIFIILFIVIFAIFAGSASNGNNCSAEQTQEDLLKFIYAFEGTRYCDKEKTEYKVYQNPGDRVTVGHGVTTDYIEDMKVGDCMPVSEVRPFEIKAVDTKRYQVKRFFSGINLTNYQEDALTSMLYNGCAGMFSDMATAYKEDSYEGLWSIMKKCTNGGTLGLERRRKAEFALFVTGDYTLAPDYKLKIFTTEEYDDYNYDDIMSRKDSVKTTCTSFNSSWIYPSPTFCPITGCQGLRFHPIYKAWRIHDGADLGCAMGTDIIASAAGEVIQVSKNYSATVGYGAYVLIQHDGEYKSKYAHMSKVIVEEGDHVEQGQKIGEVGDSGGSTGPHIHFEILKNNTVDDPAKYVDFKGVCD